MIRTARASRTKWIEAVAVCLVTSILVAGCGGGGGGGGGISASAAAATSASGSFMTSVTRNTQSTLGGVDGGVCGDPQLSEQFLLTFTPDGASVRIFSDAGQVDVVATFVGNSVQFTYVVPDGAGMRESTVNLDFQDSNDDGMFDSFGGGGSTVFSETDSVSGEVIFSCTNADAWSGSRLPAVSSAGDLTGMWDLTLVTSVSTCEPDPFATETTIEIAVFEEDASTITIALPGLTDVEATLDVTRTQLDLSDTYSDGAFQVGITGSNLLVSQGESQISGVVSFTFSSTEDAFDSCSGQVIWEMNRVTDTPVPVDTDN